MLEKTTHMNYLYDFYHLLLTPKQKEYMELYYREDYSLAEIAKLAKVSRQAVYDNIKRTEQSLESYEVKLQLYKKFKQRSELLSELEQLLSATDNKDKCKEIIDHIRKID